MAFSEAQVKSLESKLDSKHVRTRRVQDTTLAYVEGWHVIAEANRISTLGTDTHFPHAAFGLARLATTMPPPISLRSVLR
jgi:recombination DNA repair RAD52 pathway protein